MGGKLLEAGKIGNDDNAMIKAFSENLLCRMGNGVEAGDVDRDLLLKCPQDLRAVHTALGL
ncbi:MAG: hypothetical protein R3D25_03025 [Geminicoccaceae bacterium]